MEKINVVEKYGILEFLKNDKPMYRLSKHRNINQYSILEYKTGVISFFIDGWNRKKLIKKYINILSK